MTSTAKQLTVLYFAVLREQSGTDSETLASTAANPAELYTELQTRYAFTLASEQVRPAVNHAFCGWEHALNEGDTIAFIPPVSGG